MPSGNSPVISPFPPVRRVVTGHTSDGKAVFLEDKTVPTVLYSPEPGGSLKADLYRTEEFPSANSVDHVESKNEELVSDGGSTLRAWDIPPHSASPLHRTVSLDYAIVTKGTLVCQLDGDKRTTLNPGDVLIQRGTIHAWINDTDDWARVFFTMLAAKPVEINGNHLGAEVR